MSQAGRLIRHLDTKRKKKNTENSEKSRGAGPRPAPLVSCPWCRGAGPRPQCHRQVDSSGTWTQKEKKKGPPEQPAPLRGDRARAGRERERERERESRPPREGGPPAIHWPTDVSVQSGQICQSKGLVSIDRSEAAALLSTTPRLRPRSSTNDLAPLHCMGWISLRHTGAELHAGQEPCCCGLTTASAEDGRPAHIVASQCRGAKSIVTFLGGILA